MENLGKKYATKKDLVFVRGSTSTLIRAGTVCNKIESPSGGQRAMINVYGLWFDCSVDDLEVVEDERESKQVGESIADNGVGGDASNQENTGGVPVDLRDRCPACGSIQDADQEAEEGG